MAEENENRHLRETAVEFWKAAAMSGSIAIIRSFSFVTFAFLASI